MVGAFTGDGAPDLLRLNRAAPRDTWAPIGGFFLLVLAAGLLLFGRLGAPLLEPEDALFAEIPREMAAQGNWVVPTHHGQPDYQKPPLLYWLIMISYATFGVHEWSARLVPCASALGTIMVSFWWGNRTLGFRAGLAGAFVLCLSARFLYQSRMITTDGLLCLWVVTAWALGQKVIRQNRLDLMGCSLSATACGLGVLTKGPVALVLITVPLLVHQMLCKRTLRQTLQFFTVYLAIALGLATPWFAVMAWRDPVFIREFFWTHHVVMRFLRPLHEEPAWFYVPALLAGMLPWTLVLPALLKSVFRSSGPADRPAELRYVLLCCLWCLLFFSAASCKRIGYILPAMPTLALALGYALDRQLANQLPPPWTSMCHGWGSLTPYWATQGVLAAGIVTAALACATNLAKVGAAL